MLILASYSEDDGGGRAPLSNGSHGARGFSKEPYDPIRANIFEITEKALTRRLRCSQVEIRESSNSVITIERNGERLAYRIANELKKPRVLDSKALSFGNWEPVNRKYPNPKKARTVPQNHPWRGKQLRSSDQPTGDISIRAP